MRPPTSMTRYLSSACASGAGAGVGLAATFVPQAVTAAARHSDKSARLIPLRNDARAYMFPRRYGACSSDGMKLWHGARPVLVVDDDAATRKAERPALQEDGFRVVEASDGAEALQMMQHDPPAPVVLAVQMPGIDGPSFARQPRMALRHRPPLI